MASEKTRNLFKAISDFFLEDKRIWMALVSLVELFVDWIRAPWATLELCLSIVFVLWSWGFWLLPRLLRHRWSGEDAQGARYWERRHLRASRWDNLWLLVCSLLLLAVDLIHWLLFPVDDWLAAYITMTTLGMLGVLWSGFRALWLTAKLRKMEE